MILPVARMLMVLLAATTDTGVAAVLEDDENNKLTQSTGFEDTRSEPQKNLLVMVKLMKY